MGRRLDAVRCDCHSSSIVPVSGNLAEVGAPAVFGGTCIGDDLASGYDFRDQSGAPSPRPRGMQFARARMAQQQVTTFQDSLGHIAFGGNHGKDQAGWGGAPGNKGSPGTRTALLARGRGTRPAWHSLERLAAGTRLRSPVRGSTGGGLWLEWPAVC